MYAEGLQRGGGFVVARVSDDEAEEAAVVLDRQPVADIESRAQEWSRGSDNREGQELGQEGQTVPAVEGELQVGKREVAGGRVRIRTHVKGTPVEERVRLREEELSFERNQAGRGLPRP